MSQRVKAGNATGRRAERQRAGERREQDYLTLHPREPYIVYNDVPKLRELKRLFADLYRDEPVLVGESR
jgi:peptide-methionine (S)-S-oxide reductase